MARYFTEVDCWKGGFYELALELSSPSDERLLQTLAALWSAPHIDGCFADASIEPTAQSRLSIGPGLLSRGHVYGLATLDANSRLACGSCIIREDGGSDWVVFYLPMGALATVRPVGGFPFDACDHDGWRVPLDSWLADLGRSLRLAVSYDLALIGFETSGELYAADVLANGVPAQRPSGILLPRPQGHVDYFPRATRGS